MIDHKRKVVFVHIPRTGGSSIEKGFGMMDPPKKHHTASKLVNSKIKDYTWFSFIRNPYTRALSAFFQPYYKHIGYKSNKSFIYFLERWKDNLPEWEKGFTQSDYIDLPNILVFRFEDRKDILKLMSKVFNLTGICKIHEKETGSNKHLNLLGEKEKKMIQRLFQKDFMRFDYDF